MADNVELKWQSATKWSHETTDGLYYMEKTTSNRGWHVYKKNKRIGKATTLQGAKHICQHDAAIGEKQNGN